MNEDVRHLVEKWPRDFEKDAAIEEKRGGERKEGTISCCQKRLNEAKMPTAHLRNEGERVAMSAFMNSKRHNPMGLLTAEGFV